MRKASQMLITGSAGLLISSVVLFITSFVNGKIDVFAILVPFMMITLVGAFKQYQYVKK